MNWYKATATATATASVNHQDLLVNLDNIVHIQKSTFKQHLIMPKGFFGIKKATFKEYPSIFFLSNNMDFTWYYDTEDERDSEYKKIVKLTGK